MGYPGPRLEIIIYRKATIETNDRRRSEDSFELIPAMLLLEILPSFILEHGHSVR